MAAEQIRALIERMRRYGACDYAHAGSWNGSDTVSIDGECEEAADALAALLPIVEDVANIQRPPIWLHDLIERARAALSDSAGTPPSPRS